jgi:hypothetical protein
MACQPPEKLVVSPDLGGLFIKGDSFQSMPDETALESMKKLN